MVYARKICDVRRFVKIEVHAVPTGLKIYLSSHTIDTVSPKHIVLLWNIVSLIDTPKTYPARCQSQ